MDNSMNESDGNTPSAEPARRLKDAASSVIDDTKSVAADKLEQGAERVASTAHTAAQTLRRAAEDVQSDHAWMGAALRKSADSIEHATQSLAGGDVNVALERLNGFARRQPAIFLGASLALGFALARVGKTAIEQAGDETRSLQPEI